MTSDRATTTHQTGRSSLQTRIRGRSGIASRRCENAAESTKLWRFYLEAEAHLIPNPILKVLSTLSCHAVRHLLIGGQACVLYGAAEFSRDCDVVILADDNNFKNLKAALAELQADCIAIPEFKAEYLQRGLWFTFGVNTRCERPANRYDDPNCVDASHLNVLWERRTTIPAPSAGAAYEVLAIEDLV